MGLDFRPHEHPEGRHRDRRLQVTRSHAEVPAFDPGASTEGGATVWLVENGSRDGTAEMIRAEFPEVELIESRATSACRRQQHGDSPRPRAVRPRTEPRHRDHRRGDRSRARHRRVGRHDRDRGPPPRARGRNVRPRLAAIALYPRRARALHTHRTLETGTGEARAVSSPGVESGPVDAVNGAFMLIRRRALDDVGMFDEGFTWRRPLLPVSTSRLDHVVRPGCHRPARQGRTSGRHRKPRLDYAFHYGMLRFYRKHYAATRNPVLNLAVYLGIGVKFLSSVTANAMRRRLPTGT